MSTTTRFLLGAILTAVAAGCTIDKTPIPDLTGPSELGLRIALSLSPDSILGDGGSQSVLTIEASDANGRPVRGLALRIEVSEGGVTYDYGTLSAKTVITADDGRARVIFTAPRDVSETRVVFSVTPIGNDFRGQVSRTIDLRIVPPGIILPPNSAPAPQFTFTPAAPTVLENVVFDASQTTDGGALCGANCTYQWDFGDGTSATGVFVSHRYQAAGNYLVRLTVTDAQGAAVQVAQTLTVGAGAPPTGSFTVSPATPAINEQVLFNASAVQAAPGRRIVSYQWNFGNGRTGSGVVTSTTYPNVGTFPVTLTVTDDAGTEQTIGPVSVTVSATGSLTATLTVSPGGGNTGTNFFFDASASRPGPNPIVEYRFNFGDTSPEVVGTSPQTTHRFTSPGTYTVRLTIRDSAGRTATTTQLVTVN
jgi:PKD repeat protein